MDQPIGGYYTGLDKIAADHGSADFIKISPSSLSKFFSEKHLWYREHILGEPNPFKGSTSTVLGNVIHHFCEQVSNKVKVKDPDIVVAAYLASINDPDVDKQFITDNWREMSNTLIQATAVNFDAHSTEQFIHHKLDSGIYVGGSYDLLRKDYDGRLIVTDWKTASTKPSSFSYAYKLQAFTYCYILRSLGYDIKGTELQFITRATKTLPPRHFRFYEEFNDEAYDFIESLLKLMTETIQASAKHHELRHIIWQDYRLKE